MKSSYIAVSLSQFSHTECTNNFVKVEYNSGTRSLTCVFLNNLDTSEESCNVTFGECDKLESSTYITDMETANSMTVLPDHLIAGIYCYIVRASNGTYTVTVNGSISMYICIPVIYVMYN